MTMRDYILRWKQDRDDRLLKAAVKEVGAIEDRRAALKTERIIGWPENGAQNDEFDLAGEEEFEVIHEQFAATEAYMMDDERFPVWRDMAMAVAIVGTLVTVFAWSLVDMFSGIHARDPLAPVMAVGAVITAAMIALAAGFSVLRLFGDL